MLELQQIFIHSIIYILYLVGLSAVAKERFYVLKVHSLSGFVILSVIFHTGECESFYLN